MAPLVAVVVVRLDFCENGKEVAGYPSLTFGRSRSFEVNASREPEPKSLAKLFVADASLRSYLR